MLLVVGITDGDQVGAGAVAALGVSRAPVAAESLGVRRVAWHHVTALMAIVQRRLSLFMSVAALMAIVEQHRRLLLKPVVLLVSSELLLLVRTHPTR